MQASAGGDQLEDDQLQQQLRAALYRFDCPDPHTLGEYQLELLEPDQRTRVAAHALECGDCRSELQTLRAYLNQSIDVPESLISRGRRLVAAILTPAPGLAYGGLRGAAQPAVRVYEVEDITVTLGPGQGPNTLIGLVMVTSTPPEQLLGQTVRLTSSTSGAAWAATLDDIGNFEFADVPGGSYVLELELPDNLVVIEQLQLN